VLISGCVLDDDDNIYPNFEPSCLNDILHMEDSVGGPKEQVLLESPRDIMVRIMYIFVY